MQKMVKNHNILKTNFFSQLFIKRMSKQFARKKTMPIVSTLLVVYEDDTEHYTSQRDDVLDIYT